jgi:predicted GNAT family acetyltransferase
MHIGVRSAEASDIPTLLALHGDTSRNPTRESFLHQAVAAGECFLSEVDGRPAAYAVISHTFYDNGMIRMLFTHPEHRRCGLASALLRCIEAACRTAKLFTSTNLSNTPMQALLVKHGYTVTGFIDNLDEGDPELVYFKRLRNEPR